jgi:hypothetical protein
MINEQLYINVHAIIVTIYRYFSCKLAMKSECENHKMYGKEIAKISIFFSGTTT